MERGLFACPICVKQQPYELRVLTRWFTLFFLPILRTRSLGEYVFCLGCHNSLKRSVLLPRPGTRVAPVPALQSLVDAMPTGAATPPTHQPAPVPAAQPATETVPAAARPAPAPRAQETLRLAPRLLSGSSTLAPSASAAPAAAPDDDAHERPAFGQSAFAKATYARQRRPAPPPFGPTTTSEPAFFTPRR